MDPEWQPSAEVTRLGQEFYIRYLAGLAIVHTPDSPFSRHQLAESSRDPEAMLVRAEEIMVDGLRGVILSANKRERQGGLVAAEGNFSGALPHMLHVVDSAYHLQGKRIDSIDDMYYIQQPAPFLDEVVYRHLCHGRGDKLMTKMLLAGYVPAENFADLIRNRYVPLDVFRRRRRSE